MSTKVSVVMPVRNGGRWLRIAVDSVLAQDFADFELLAVDDGSTDDTPAILAAYAADPRVRVLRPDGSGLVAALNCAIAAARGEYLARLDADDWAAPGRLSRQVAIMDARPRLGLLGSWVEMIDEDGKVLGIVTREADPARLPAELQRTNQFAHSSVMMRTALVRRLGGYRAAFEAAEDYDLWLRIAEAAEVANLPEPLIRYRCHSGSVTRQKELRACFSVRLAQRAAALRRAGRHDPSAALDRPPDWQAAPEGAFYAEDARLYRLLELAETDTPVGRRPDLEPLLKPSLPLSSKERRLAQRAVWRLLADPGQRAGGLLPLLRLGIGLHPARALPLAWRSLARRSSAG